MAGSRLTRIAMRCSSARATRTSKGRQSRTQERPAASPSRNSISNCAKGSARSTRAAFSTPPPARRAKSETHFATLRSGPADYRALIRPYGKRQMDGLPPPPPPPPNPHAGGGDVGADEEGGDSPFSEVWFEACRQVRRAPE